MYRGLPVCIEVEGRLRLLTRVLLETERRRRRRRRKAKRDNGFAAVRHAEDHPISAEHLGS